MYIASVLSLIPCVLDTTQLTFEIGNLVAQPPRELEFQLAGGVAHLNREVVDKLLHTPTVKIKELAATGGSVSVEDAVTELFGLGRPAVAVEAQRLPLPEELHGKEK